MTPHQAKQDAFERLNAAGAKVLKVQANTVGKKVYVYATLDPHSVPKSAEEFGTWFATVTATLTYMLNVRFGPKGVK